MSGPVVLVLRALLAVSLYAFLAWALISLWRDIKQQGDLLATRRTPPITLSVIHGDTGTQVRHFVQPEVTIGRDPACECPIEDDAVSARHARLSYHHNHWWLEDLNSTNGVLLNQDKLTTPTVLITDDEFICGDTRFIISLTGDSSMSATRKLKNDRQAQDNSGNNIRTDKGSG